MMAVASTSCEPVTDAGVRYVAIAEDGTVVATMAEYIIGSLESMQSATTSDGGRTWTNADKTYRKEGNESVQIPRGHLRNSASAVFNRQKKLRYSWAVGLDAPEGDIAEASR